MVACGKMGSRKSTCLNLDRGVVEAARRAGLAAVHPVAEALKDEYFHFAWLLRREAFLRFGYDPDRVFCERVDERGFKK